MEDLTVSVDLACRRSVLTPRGQEAAALALHRFGFGPRNDSIALFASDPHAALLADLERPDAGQLIADLPSSAQSAREVFEFQAKRRAQQKLALRIQKTAKTEGEALAMAALEKELPAQNAPGPHPPPMPQRLLLKEAQARFDAATAAEIGFVERLVWFWSNHFCISADKVAGMFIAQGVLAALVARAASGEGQRVEVPMFDAALAFNLVEHLARAAVPGPRRAPVVGR